MTEEKDPSGKAAKESGSKLDSGKSPAFRGLLDYFPRACLAVAEVSNKGAEKYCWKGWEDVPDGINRYSDAIVRHMCKESIEGSIDPDFGLLHKAHTAWNAMAVLELELRAREVPKVDQREASILEACVFKYGSLEYCKNKFNDFMSFAGFTGKFGKDKDMTPGE